jgi:6-pyruvoyltetrahydropterin/6-carboxytetrahydropterin synthase
VAILQSEVDPESGMSMDFAEIRQLARERVLDSIDHNDLNRILDNPTAENVVVWIWDRLLPALPGLVELQLFETPDFGVIYRGEADGQARGTDS